MLALDAFLHTRIVCAVPMLATRKQDGGTRDAQELPTLNVLGLWWHFVVIRGLDDGHINHLQHKHLPSGPLQPT